MFSPTRDKQLNKAKGQVVEQGKGPLYTYLFGYPILSIQ